VPDGVGEAERYVEAALAHQATGTALAWAVRRLADGRVVGSTRFVDLEAFAEPATSTRGSVLRGSVPSGSASPTVPSADRPPSVGEIGYTWYAASAQRTGINAECKLLLLGHAFEVWAMERVTLKTDARNLRSRQAIERLGAQFEGVRRAHQPAVDGGLRDTAYFSILAREWPDVRSGLLDRLARRGPGALDIHRSIPRQA
jgi:RimJ/RimL family protein N-acetyltransferase